MQAVGSKYECEAAAGNLGLKDTGASQVGWRSMLPDGCIYAADRFQLLWNPSGSSYKCGSTYGGYEYSCICAPGIVPY